MDTGIVSEPAAMIGLDESAMQLTPVPTAQKVIKYPMK